jgi:HEAT repeat protein
VNAAPAARPVLIAHAEGDDEFAERLAGPIRAAGYHVVHHGTVLVGESLREEVTRVLTAGGPVVLCGTIRAMGTTWAQSVVNAARGFSGVRVFGVQIERDANLRYLTFDTEVASFWLDPDRATNEVVAALRKYYPVEPGANSSSPVSDPAAEHRFRDLLLEACDIIDLANMPTDRQLVTRHLTLRSLFVPLKVQVEREAGQDVEAEEFIALEHRRRRARSGGQARVHPSPSARDGESSRLQAGSPLARQTLITPPSVRRVQSSLAPVGQRLQQSRRLVILGDPGAGKTTLLRWMATAYLLRLRGDADWSVLPAVHTLPDENWLPVLIRCRDLGPEQLSGTLEDMVTLMLRRSELAAAEVNILKEVVAQRLDSGTALLLIDGLDEISDSAARARFCQHLEQIHLARPSTPIIATSRIVGYREMGYRIGRGFEHLTVADLGASDKDDFIRRWCAVTEQPSRQHTAEAQLMADIHGTDRIERLTSNPLLLTTMALVKRKVGKLPDHRSDLYREAVDVLLNWRSEVDEPIDHHEAMPQLLYLAYAMSDRGVQQLTDDEIVALLDEMRAEYPRMHSIRRRPTEEFIRLLERRTGILVESGHVRLPGRLAPVFEFRHLTFQEYLAALAIVRGLFPGRDRSKSLAKRVGPLAGRLSSGSDEPEATIATTWRETLRLCVTICDPDDVDSVLSAVLTTSTGEASTDEARSRAVLAAECLEDEPDASDDMVDEILRRLVAQVQPNDDDSDAEQAVLKLAKSRWAAQLVGHLIRELRARGERAVPHVGRLCGRTVAESAPTDDAELSTWLWTQATAADGEHGDDALPAVLAIGAVAERARTGPWSEAAPQLLRLLTVDDVLLVGAAAWALAQLRETWGPAAWHPTYQEIDRIRAAVGRPVPDPLRTLSLVTAAGARRLAPELKPLAIAATDRDQVVRAAAARVLGQTAREDAAALLVDLLDDAEPKVRAQGAQALGDLGSSRGLTALLRHLDDPDVGVRADVVNALGRLGDTRAVERLLSTMGDADHVVRGRAMSALGMLGDRRAFEQLLAHSMDLDGDNAWQAAYALGQLGDGRAVEPLLSRLEDESDDVRWWVADALGELGDRRAFEALSTRLDDASPRVRTQVVGALGRLDETRALAPITSALADADPNVREQVVDVLGDFGDNRALETLTKALGDPSAGIRSRAAGALGRLADARGLDHLLAALHDTDAGVRSSAAKGLGGLGEERALEPLLEALRDGYPDVRSNAAEALRELVDTQAVGALVTTLVDPVPRVREQVIDALSEIEDRRCVPALRRRLADTDSSVRGSAAGALGQLGDLRSLGVIAGRLDAADSTERTWAAYALGQLGDSRAVPWLVARLDDPHPTVRQFAVGALGQLDTDLVLEPLLARLDDPYAAVRRQVIDALGSVGDLRAMTPLLAHLDDPNTRVRSGVVRALGEIGADGALDAVLTCLDDEHGDVRGQAAWVLGVLGDTSAVEHLLQRLDDPSANVCEGVVWALGQVGDARAVSPVAELLSSPSRDVRGRAVEALAKLDTGSAVPWLVSGLADPHPKVRERAAWGLGRCRSELAIEPLSTGLRDSNPEVRDEAAVALGRIRHPAALGPLMASLQDPAIRVRGEAARALGRLRDTAAREPLQHAADDADPWVRSLAGWSLGQLGDTRSRQTLRPLLASTAGATRRVAAAVLSNIGDRYARRLLRRGLTAGAAATRREWVATFARILPDMVDNDLLSRDGDAMEPYLDSQARIDRRRVDRMARLLRLDPAEVIDRYTRLAKTVPLRLSDHAVG